MELMIDEIRWILLLDLFVVEEFERNRRTVSVSFQLLGNK